MKHEIEALERQIDHQQDQLLKGSVEFEKEKLAHETTYKFLAFFLDDQEAIFGNDKKFESIELCIQYIDAAKWCERFGRTNHIVKTAQEWMYEQQLPEKETYSDTRVDLFSNMTVKWDHIK